MEIKKWFAITANFYHILGIFSLRFILTLPIITTVYIIPEVIAQTSNSQSTDTKISKLTTYENHTYGVKLQYPSNWKAVENKSMMIFNGSGSQSKSPIFVKKSLSCSSFSLGFRCLRSNDLIRLTNIVTFYSPKENNSDKFQDLVSIEVMPSKNMSMYSFNNEVDSFLHTFLPKYNLTKTGSIMLSSFPATKILFTCKEGQKIIRGLGVEIIVDKNAYLILYLAEPSSYYNHSLIVQNMLNSFGEFAMQKSPALVGLKVQSQPTAVAVNPNTNRIYVANRGSDTVSVIDGQTDKAVTNVTVDRGPFALAVNSNIDRIYVVNSGSDTVSVIDGATNKVIGTLKIGFEPTNIAIDRTGYVYVANYGSNTVDRIHDSEGNMSIQQTFEVGKSPNDLAADESDNVYVTELNNDAVAKISAAGSFNFQAQLDQHIKVSKEPVAITFNPNNDLLYVTHDSGNISVIDTSTNTVERAIKTGMHGDHISINPATNKLYITHFNSNYVDVIDGSTNTQNKTINVGNTIYHKNDIFSNGISINPNTNIIYITNEGSDTLFMVNGSTDKPMVGLTFNINPPNSGFIKCNNGMQTWIASNNNYMHLSFGTELNCQAITKMQNERSPFFGPVDNFLMQVQELFTGGIKFKDWSDNNLVSNSTDNNISFKASKYGVLTANFIEISPSTDLLVAIIGTVLPIVTIIVGWLITKRRRSYLDRYIKTIDTVYTSKYRNKEEGLQHLDEIRNQITSLYAKGTLSESDYDVLKDKVSEYAEKINNNSM